VQDCCLLDVVTQHHFVHISICHHPDRHDEICILKLKHCSFVYEVYIKDPVYEAVGSVSGEHSWALLPLAQTILLNVSICAHFAVFDPSLAPPGKAVVHAYYAANEPYDLWKGMDTKSAEYKALKEQRAEPLWKVGGLGRDGKYISAIKLTFVAGNRGA